MLATSDGGATWTVATPQGTFGTDAIGDVDFVDAVHGWASGTAIYPHGGRRPDVDAGGLRH